MTDLIHRNMEEFLELSLKEMPVTAVLGPRQCGKTTLIKILAERDPDIILLDMENPDDLRVMEDASAFFKFHRDKLICIDEVQRVPELFPILRYEVDQDNNNGRFVILGSASPDLLRQSSETLAGRIRYLELTPFLLDEIKEFSKELHSLWLRGGFPRSFLADSDGTSYRWRDDFIRTFLERDIPTLGFKVASSQMNRFWTMLSHVNGTILNRSKLGQSLGVSHHTINHHLDILSDTFMMRVLTPYEANLKKRLVKSPKILFRDTGLLHNLLRIRDFKDLMSHPGYGSSWEAFAIEQILSVPGVSDRWNSYFYRSHKGEEIDLVLDNGMITVGIEMKAYSSPEIPKGFRIACKDLNIDHSWIVAPVERLRPAGEKIMVGQIKDLISFLLSL